MSLYTGEKSVETALCSLYRNYGYTRFKMSKFEEYDLYAGNKDFLISDHVITFTDTNGKLMALKPDVTLSIIKNAREKAVDLQKVYYNENVYRVSGSTEAFKEIEQCGLECIGDIDDWSLCEVLILAAESLSCISPDYVLDLSDLDLVSFALDRLEVSEKTKRDLLSCVSEKNLHGIGALCTAAGVSEEKSALLCRLVALNGEPSAAIESLRKLFPDGEGKAAVERLAMIVKVLCKCGHGDKIRVDFSVIHDMKYYNGIVFRGFVNGVPTGVLSGGQYDRMMQKMGKKAGAVGFAVYLDLLERLREEKPEFDLETVLLYDDATDPAALALAMRDLTLYGERVISARVRPEKIRYKRLARMTESGVEILENNA